MENYVALTEQSGETRSSTAAQARARRARLMNPPNAVPDLGIDLKRKPEPPKPTAKVILISQHWPEATPLPVVTVARPHAESVLPSTEETVEAGVVYPKISMIVQEVAIFYKLSVIDILARRRTANVCQPRQVAMYLGKELTLLSLPRIGRQMADRDHTTVLYAHRKIKALLETDERLRDEIDLLKLRIADRVVASVRTETPQDAPCSSPPTLEA